MTEIEARLADGVKVEVWWRDEARIGQWNKITSPLSRIASKPPPGDGWARRRTRSSASKDQRARRACLGAICPARGEAVGIVAPYANTEAMQAHLAEISVRVAPGAHAVLTLD